jgi:hypothetical protein
MRRVALAVAVGLLIAALGAPATADAGKRKRPSGIVGTVVNSTCYGPCVYPQPASPPYTGGGLTVEIRRAADGALVASRQPSDGHFRAKVKRGLYTVTALVTELTPTPTPQGSEAPMPPPSCWQGESKQVQVFRHRFSPVELQVTNACIV